jgi:hypothetical protein
MRRAAVPALALALTYGALFVRLDWPVHGGDTGRLLEEAASLASGQPPGPRGAAFLLPHALLAVIAAVGLPVTAYVFVQVTLALAATATLFGLTRLAGGSGPAATLAATAWAANPFVQQWNLFLLADGLYQSLLVITAYALARALTAPQVGKNCNVYDVSVPGTVTIGKNCNVFAVTVPGTVTIPGAWAVVAAAGVVATAICRPQGQSLPAIACIVLLLARRGGLEWAAAALLVMLQVALVWIDRHYVEYLDVAQHLANGQVIWGYFDFRLSMPPWPGDGGGVSALLAYCAAHPLACGKLAATRILVEMSAARPFYSTLHNALALLFYWPLYVLAVVGLRVSASSPARTITVLVFVTHVAIVGATHADWDGRWLLEVVPFLLVWASLGVTSMLERWNLVPREARWI